MKYASEVIELMGAYPGRLFRMVEIVRYVCPSPRSPRERSAVREAIRIVLAALKVSGAIFIRKPRANSCYYVYIWKSANCHGGKVPAKVPNYCRDSVF